MSPQIAYPFGRSLYLNLTQRCPTGCAFCFKTSSHRRFHGHDLSLDAEPTTEQAWQAVLGRPAQERYQEVVFCGYGESTYRLEAMLELGARLRLRFPASPRRLNTVGLGSVIWGRDIAPELAAGLDLVCVSLNTADPEQWRRLHRPVAELGPAGHADVVSFIESCVRSGLRTTVTAVELPGVDLPAVRSLAARLGAAFRPRPLLSDGLDA